MILDPNQAPPPTIDLGGNFWLPRQLSTLAKDIDWAWNIVTALAIFFFIGVVGAMTYFVWKYRRRTENDKVSTVEHSTIIEVVWTVIPTLLCFGLFFAGFKGYLNASIVEAEAYEIKALAKKWSWTFIYPNGVVTTELGVPKDRPVRILLSSQDVLHSFYVPEFRVKQDAVPGTYTSLWFRATGVGETALLCTEYCGTSHSNMLAKVVIMEEDKFNKWLESKDDSNVPLADLGKKLYTDRACAGCHSLDGTRGSGPSYKGLFGKKEKLADGTEVTADENYLRESILQPGAKIVAGFDNVMPAFQGQLNEKQILALIEFIKAQK